MITNADSKSIRWTARTFSCLLTLTIGSSVLRADDVEVYLTPPPDPVPPNVLFILDESYSMNTSEEVCEWKYVYGRLRYVCSSGDSRMQQLKDAMVTLLDDPNMGNVNAGILGYTTLKLNEGNNGTLKIRVISDFMKIEDNREAMKTSVQALTPTGYTPTVKTLEAAAAWFNSGYGGFESPIATNEFGYPLWCQTNHMVLLTDGSPNSNSGDYKLTAYNGTTCDSNVPFGDIHPSDSQFDYGGLCAGEIADWVYSSDLRLDASWPETQNVTTHTIGFQTGTDEEAFLRHISTNGHGDYYPATSAADLVSAFSSIVTEAQESIPYTYNAPAIPFNPDNAAVSGNRIYVPMIKPMAERFWKGNLKKYAIGTGGDGALVITDANGLSVVDSTFRFLDRRDFWNASNDGGDPLVGGAASHMHGASRNLYTFLGATTDLTAPENRVAASNTAITAAMLGVDGAGDPAAERTAVLNWVSWQDTAHQGELGAPIHSKPEVVNYAGGADVVLLPTTEGVLEAIDAQTGEELWAFMPASKLSRIAKLKENSGSEVPEYGLDGPLTVYQSGGRTYAVVGMRRGGNSYYALDVSNRAVPQFAWSITGGSAGFERLGQTWSKPLFVKMEIGGGSAAEVLIFGGGYDTDQDDLMARANDDVGNAIFIVNARTGGKIMSVSSSGADLNIADMLNSIPGDLLPVDINANGITDRIYAADVGGRIVRVDVPDHGFGSTSVSGGVVADVNSGGSGYQRFFNTPEVAYFSRGGIQFLAVLIGSGYRPSPLDTSVTDRFYMIKDTALWEAPETYETVAESDLYDATANLLQSGSGGQQAQAELDLGSAMGWYINLTPGEKVFSKAAVYDFVAFFTTYKGERDAQNDPCTLSSTRGESRFYAIHMLNGSAVFEDLDGNGSSLTTSDRSKLLHIPGMPPAPTLLFPGNEDGSPMGEVRAIVGLEEAVSFPDKFLAIYWEEVLGQ